MESDIKNYIDKGDYIDKRSMPKEVSKIEDKIVIMTLSDHELIGNAILGAISALPKNTNAIHHLIEIQRMYYQYLDKFQLVFSEK